MPALITRRRLLAAAFVAIAIGTAPSPSFAGAGPLEFARSLYALENFWNDVTADEATMRMYLDENLMALVRENYAKESFEGALDYDPLIQAQDFDEVKTTYTVNSENDKNAAVTVRVNNFGEVTFVTLELTATPDGWRLSDIRAADGSSLVAELKRLNVAS